jgi:hypothetical protein
MDKAESGFSVAVSVSVSVSVSISSILSYSITRRKEKVFGSPAPFWGWRGGFDFTYAGVVVEVVVEVVVDGVEVGIG